MKMKGFFIISMLIVALFLNPQLFFSLVLGIIFVSCIIDTLFEDDVNINKMELNDKMFDTILTFFFVNGIYIFSVIAFFNFFNMLF